MQGHNRMQVVAGMVLSGLVLAAAPAWADDKDKPAKADPFARCASLQDDQDRLACYDKVAKALKAAAGTQAEASAQMPAQVPAEAPEQASAQAPAEIAEEPVSVSVELTAPAEDAAPEKPAETASKGAPAAESDADLAAREAELKRREEALLEREAEVQAAQEAEASGKPLLDRSPEVFGAQDLANRPTHSSEDGADEDTKPLKRIEATITALARNGRGQIVVRLENGHVWRQKYSEQIASSRARTVVIHRGILGSYRMQLDGRGKSFPVERVK